MAEVMDAEPLGCVRRHSFTLDGQALDGLSDAKR